MVFLCVLLGIIIFLDPKEPGKVDVKAPAAICRKVSEVEDGGAIEVGMMVNRPDLSSTLMSVSKQHVVSWIPTSLSLSTLDLKRWWLLINLWTSLLRFNKTVEAHIPDSNAIGVRRNLVTIWFVRTGMGLSAVPGRRYCQNYNWIYRRNKKSVPGTEVKMLMEGLWWNLFTNWTWQLLHIVNRYDEISRTDVALRISSFS